MISRTAGSGLNRFLRNPVCAAVCTVTAALPCAAANNALFPLDSVLSRSDSSVLIEWIPSAANTLSDWFVSCGALCTGSDTVCLRSDFIAGSSYQGEAYSYGGEDPYQLFRLRVAQGVVVGSHLCHYRSCGDPTPTVTGTDCSGFVCYAWSVPRLSTATMFTAYTRITYAEVRPGDALVKPGSHVVLVLDVDADGSMLISESYGTPVNGCRERVINPGVGTWQTDYHPIRNTSIVAAVTHAVPARASEGRRSGAVVLMDPGNVLVRSAAVLTLQGKRTGAGHHRQQSSMHRPAVHSLH